MQTTVSVTFDVEICNGSKREDTTMTIFEKYIEFSKTRGYENNHFRKTTKIKFKKLSHILLNNSSKEYKDKYRARSFGLKHNGIVLNFMTKHKWQRDTILLEILNRCTRNNINPSHRESIQWAKSEVVLNVLENDGNNAKGNGFNPFPGRQRGSTYANPGSERLVERDRLEFERQKTTGSHHANVDIEKGVESMDHSMAAEREKSKKDRLKFERAKQEIEGFNPFPRRQSRQRESTYANPELERSQRSKMNVHDEQNSLDSQSFNEWQGILEKRASRMAATQRDKETVQKVQKLRNDLRIQLKEQQPVVPLSVLLNADALQRVRGEKVTEHRKMQSDAMIDTVQRVNTEKPAKSERSQRSKMNDQDEQNEIEKQREELHQQFAQRQSQLMKKDVDQEVWVEAYSDSEKSDDDLETLAKQQADSERKQSESERIKLTEQLLILVQKNKRNALSKQQRTSTMEEKYPKKKGIDRNERDLLLHLETQKRMEMEYARKRDDLRNESKRLKDWERDLEGQREILRSASQRLEDIVLTLRSGDRLNDSIAIMTQQVQALQRNADALRRVRGEQVMEYRKVQSDAVIDTVQRVNTEKPAKPERSQRSKMNDQDEQNEIERQREQLQRQREELQREREELHQNEIERQREELQRQREELQREREELHQQFAQRQSQLMKKDVDQEVRVEAYSDSEKSDDDMEMLAKQQAESERKQLESGRIKLTEQLRILVQKNKRNALIEQQKSGPMEGKYPKMKEYRKSNMIRDWRS